MCVEYLMTGSSIMQVSLKTLLGAWPSTLALHMLGPLCGISIQSAEFRVKLEHSLRRVPYSSPFKMTDSGDNTNSYLLSWSPLSEEMSATNLSWQMHAVLFSVLTLASESCPWEVQLSR